MTEKTNQSSGAFSGLITIVVIIIIIAIIKKKHKNKANSAAQRTVRQLNISSNYVPNNYSQEISVIDYMDGHDFEYWCADLLKYNGFSNIQVTPGSGDQGVDIIAIKDKQKYAIQCKRYSKNLGNKPIQEVNTGRTIYKCNYAAVMTNVYFTSGAINAAKAVGVLLWDRDSLTEMLAQKNTTLYRQSREHKRELRAAKKQQRSGNNKQITTNTGMVGALRQPFCGNCGAQLQENERFCKYCGTPIIGTQNSNKNSTATQLNSYQHFEKTVNEITAHVNSIGKAASTGQKSASGNVSWNEQALRAAKEYLSYGSFSRSGLIEQLKYDKYTDDQARYAAEHCGANWQEQAEKEVKTYLASSGFSRKGLIEQLIYDGYNEEEARIAVDKSDVQWKYQAFREAQTYLDTGAYSKDELIEQLEYDGFTHEEAAYAADRV